MKKENINKINFLIVDNDENELQHITGLLNSDFYFTYTASKAVDAVTIINNENIDILVVCNNLTVSLMDTVCSLFNKKNYLKPVQTVILFSNDEELIHLTAKGADDYIRKPISPLEFDVRIKAAVIRYHNQKSIYDEKEYFRQAIKQEEELASRILDQHMYLKQAFLNIEDINMDLEKSNKRLEKLAKYDILSGLLNRMTLFSEMDVEIERSIRSKSPLSGIMVDIDRFKTINDNFGHPHGDEVIRCIGDHLQKSLRKYDHAGRYGGEEFFMLLPETNSDDAYIIAERFRRKLETTPIDYMGDIINITASLGIAEYKIDETREIWIARADKAMYEAKQNGRNMVYKSAC